jgi:hypothetical protein
VHQTCGERQRECAECGVEREGEKGGGRVDRKREEKERSLHTQREMKDRATGL